MIQYLKNDQIDRRRWDDCITHAVNRRIYGFSWYLDRVAPGWEALITPDYDCVFPLTRNRKYGIRYLCQPFFAQQLGLFSRTLPRDETVSAFLDFIARKFSFAEIQLNSLNTVTTSLWNIVLRLNHVLPLELPYIKITGGYAQNAVRNLKKAREEGVMEGPSPEPEQLVELFRKNFGEREGKLQPAHYETITGLIRYLTETGIGHTAGVYSARGRLDAAAVFVLDGQRWYYLFAASSAEARANGAMFHLIDRFIARHCGQPLVLDFEGGNDPGMGRFYKGFGATEEIYPFVSMSRLPAFVPATRTFLGKIGFR